jgi:hypothetical protein
MSPPTLEEARASGQIVEHESAGVTYSYTPRNSWIDGHEWASPSTIEERLEDTSLKKTTRSWLLAQCLWWNEWTPGLKCPRSLTKVNLAGGLYHKIMEGGVRRPHAVIGMEVDAVVDVRTPSKGRLGRAGGRLDREVWGAAGAGNS